jgi:hypothetical protein
MLRAAGPTLLGRTYASDDDGASELARELRDRLLWVTYRRGFAPLPGTRHTSDKGWGCTIRSSQMLVASAVLRLRLPRAAPTFDANRPDSDPASPANYRPARAGGGGWPAAAADAEAEDGSSDLEAVEQRVRKEVASLFIDWPLPSAALSLHNFVAEAREMRHAKGPGEWFGPHEASYIMARLAARGYQQQLLQQKQQQLLQQQQHTWQPTGDPVPCRIVVCGDMTLYKSAIYDAATHVGPPPLSDANRAEVAAVAEQNNGTDAAELPWLRPVLAIIPLRLGLGATLNKAYIPQVRVLSHYSVQSGIIDCSSVETV